jgi:CheY-like chemotaxis protein
MTPVKSILVVDDDPGVRALLRQVIGGMGHQVEEAGDAMSALEMMEHGTVGFALVDVRMPGRDGVWLVDQIVTRFPHVPVALATGLLEMDPHVTLRPGVVGYVTKPFIREDLAIVIKAALNAQAVVPPMRMDVAAFVEAH